MGGWVLKMKLKLLKLSTKFKLKLKLKFGKSEKKIIFKDKVFELKYLIFKPKLGQRME